MPSSYGKLHVDLAAESLLLATPKRGRIRPNRDRRHRMVVRQVRDVCVQSLETFWDRLKSVVQSNMEAEIT